MAIVKMKRLRVIALAEQRDQLLSRLLHVGCVEVTEPDAQLTEAEGTSVLARDTGSQGAVKAEINAVSAAMTALDKYAPAKSGLISVRPDVSEAEFFDETRRENALSAAQEINDRVTEIGQLYTEENRLRSAMESFTPWKGMEEPLDIQSTEHVEITLGTLPAASSVEEARGKLAELAPASELVLVSTNKELHHLVLLALKEEYSQALDALKPFSFSVVRFKDAHGNAADNLVRLGEEIAQVEQKRERATEAIQAQSDQRKELKLAFDRLTQDAAVEAVKDNSLTDGTICVLEGWTPVPKLDKVEKELKALGCAYELTDPQEGDEVPTLLENPKWMRGINMVTEMYSLPTYDGIDPNPLMFFWYVFFFGFMFADVAYGLIIWIASVIISKKFKPKNTLGYMFALGKWLGFSTFFCGIFVGGFFGNVITTFAETFLGLAPDQLPHWLQVFCNGIVVNPVENPMTVLIIALAVGCVHLLFGQCIHIYMNFRDGTPLEGILDVVPWWIVFVGVACLALGGPKWVILLGVLALICTQGRAKKGVIGKLFGGIASLYDVTSWLGDVLSYARLMALMLATSVIAMVFNTLAAMPKLLIVFIIVFLIGHVFNIGVNLIGTYVHAARLQYLEFFGKFYKEGGIPFRPLKYNTKYVDVINKEEN